MFRGRTREETDVVETFVVLVQWAYLENNSDILGYIYRLWQRMGVWRIHNNEM